MTTSSAGFSPTYPTIPHTPRGYPPVLVDGRGASAGFVPRVAVVRVSDRFRLRRSALPQVDAEDRDARDREELRLPVLQAPVPEVGLAEIGRVGDGRFFV